MTDSDKLQVDNSRTDPNFLPIFVDRNERHLGLGHPYNLPWSAEPLGLDIHVNCDRCIADSQRIGIKAHQIADEHRLVKDDLLHRDRYKPIVPRVPDRLNTASDVDVTQNSAAKNRAVGVRIPRHHGEPYRCIAFD